MLINSLPSFYLALRALNTDSNSITSRWERKFPVIRLHSGDIEGKDARTLGLYARYSRGRISMSFGSTVIGSLW